MSEMKAVIASSMAPMPEKWDEFVSDVREAFPNLKGMNLMHGPGCWNYGVIGLNDGELQQLTMALMPARWTNVTDCDDGIEIGEWIDKR